jgi:hypothetical protein
MKYTYVQWVGKGALRNLHAIPNDLLGIYIYIYKRKASSLTSFRIFGLLTELDFGVFPEVIGFVICPTNDHFRLGSSFKIYL